jgi:hypothetical protein
MFNPGELVKTAMSYGLNGKYWPLGTPCIIVKMIEQGPPPNSIFDIWEIMLPGGVFTRFDDSEIAKIR